MLSISGISQTVVYSVMLGKYFYHNALKVLKTSFWFNWNHLQTILAVRDFIVNRQKRFQLPHQLICLHDAKQHLGLCLCKASTYWNQINVCHCHPTLTTSDQLCQCYLLVKHKQIKNDTRQSWNLTQFKMFYESEFDSKTNQNLTMYAQSKGKFILNASGHSLGCTWRIEVLVEVRFDIILTSGAHNISGNFAPILKMYSLESGRAGEC